jgi:hypothetical protein
MRRKITHGRRAAEKLARKWFAAAGVQPHFIGFSDNDGFYVIVHCLVGRRVRDYPVACWGVRVLRREVEKAIADYRGVAAST